MDAILTSVITALITTGIIALLKSRHLTVVVPKAAFFSPVTSGSTIHMTVLNGGFRTEENITIRLNQGAKYDLLAASRSDIKVDRTEILIPRLNKFSQATIMIVVEGKGFDITDVLGVDSKETVGKVVEKAADAPSKAGQFIGLSVVFLFLGAVFLIGTMFGAEFKVNLYSYFTDRYIYDGQIMTPKKVNWSRGSDFKNAEISKKYGDKMPFEIEDFKRKGDLIEFTVVASNYSNGFATFGARSKSPDDDDNSNVGFRDGFLSDLVVEPSGVKKKKMLVYVPKDSKTSTFVVDFDVRFEDTSESYYYSETVHI